MFNLILNYPVYNIGVDQIPRLGKYKRVPGGKETNSILWVGPEHLLEASQSPEASEGLCAGRNSSGPRRTRQEPGRKRWGHRHGAVPSFYMGLGNPNLSPHT